MPQVLTLPCCGCLDWVRSCQQLFSPSSSSSASRFYQQSVIPPNLRSDSKPVHARALRGANRGRSKESFCEGKPRKLDRNPGDQKSWNPCNQFQFNQQVPDEISNFLDPFTKLQLIANPTKGNITKQNINQSSFSVVVAFECE